MTDFTSEYEKYFTSRQFTRLGVFELLRAKYDIKKALYLGSHIHITPSIVFPEVVYVDSYKKFKDMVDSDEARKFIEQNKKYDQAPSIRFIQQNYDKTLDIENDFDLLISQYAGFVSRVGKKYLKKGGILLANNSHGDASMANLDHEFDLIAVANHTKDKWRINNTNVDEYFIRKDGAEDTAEELIDKQKGPAYKKTATNYIFKKTN